MSSMVPTNMQLSRNPMLPQHPLGAYTDSQYEAQNALLRNEIAKKYADILQQLGYVDPQTGQFVQGSVEAEATKRKADLTRSADIAGEGVTKQHQLEGTLFSGLRGTDQARAEHPYVNEIGDIETQTPLTLAQLYEKAGGLIGDYTLQDNQYIAEAAARRAAGFQQPGGGGDGSGGGGGGGDNPPSVPAASAGTYINSGLGAGLGTQPAGTGAALGSDAANINVPVPHLQTSGFTTSPPVGPFPSALGAGLGSPPPVGPFPAALGAGLAPPVPPPVLGPATSAGIGDPGAVLAGGRAMLRPRRQLNQDMFL